MEDKIEELICISRRLKRHPILNENIEFRFKYLNILKQFMVRYETEDFFSKALFEHYKKYLLQGEIKNDTICFKDIELGDRNSNWIYRAGIRRDQFLRYRVALLIDCLFLCASFQEKKVKKILNDLCGYWPKNYQRELKGLYQSLCQGKMPSKDQKDLVEEWKIDWHYYLQKTNKILVTANMSAGKSTLINALIGKMITRSQNDSCTAKLHFIKSKAFEDDFNYEYDHDFVLDADKELLMNDNDNNVSDEIWVGTYFRFMTSSKPKICFVDTPGVNSAMDAKHRRMTEEVVEQGRYDKLIYVINGQNIGTTDDKQYMEYIAKVCEKKQVLFVVNKLDSFKKNEDNILNSLQKIMNDIYELGFENINICPVSAYAGILAKKYLWDDKLDEDEIDDLEVLRRKFLRKEYDLSQYYPEKIQAIGRSLVNNENDKNRKKYVQLLNNAGILALEYMLL